MAAAGHFFLFPNIQTSPGAHPDSFSVSTKVLSQGIKWLGHEVDNSPSSNARFKNEWSYTSAHLVCLLGLDVDNFTFFYNLVFAAVILHSQYDVWKKSSPPYYSALLLNDFTV
jgi:hypothetical protein